MNILKITKKTFLFTPFGSTGSVLKVSVNFHVAGIFMSALKLHNRDELQNKLFVNNIQQRLLL